MIDDVAIWLSELKLENIENLPFHIGRKDLDQRFIDATLPMLKIKGLDKMVPASLLHGGKLK